MHLFAVFHLNLAYSSIEEEQRPEVIEKCYWPLLRLAKAVDLPLGIEAPGYTLEAIAAIDPEWIDELRRLISGGRCEFIGSGYAQIIGPLVPAAVNQANLKIGNDVYRDLVGVKPSIALVNEQAYSAGLVPLYLEAGYEAIIMEWNNPSRFHPEWAPAWRFLPQKALGPGGESIGLIWNDAIAFQKFQRYAHAEMELDEYLTYLAKQIGDGPGAFSLYANDVEIFNFRPGRFLTEATLRDDEWKRLELLFQTLMTDERFSLISPKEVLGLGGEAGAGRELRLESTEQPIPVKKQGKYNVTRWAVTGRDDLDINTRCWRIYEVLENAPAATEADWHELCYLWSSDFRTHITEARWRNYLVRLKAFEGLLAARWPTVSNRESLKSVAHTFDFNPKVERHGRYLTVETKSVRVRLNTDRGLTIDALTLGASDRRPQCRTLPHGYYDDITFGSDWYTGHIVVETPGRPKVTDLMPVEPTIETSAEEGNISIEGTVGTPLGSVTKRLLISNNAPALACSYIFDWQTRPVSSFRIGHITLNPEAFDRSTLYYRTCNGGEPETFPLAGTLVEHGKHVSFLVSADSGTGLTEGWIEFGDDKQSLRVEVDRTSAAVIGLIDYREVGGTYFCRLTLSAGEMDETSHLNGTEIRKIECQVRLMLGGSGS